MSTHLKDKEERIQKIISQLIEKSTNGIPIVVEGKKDAEALCNLGVIGKIITIKTGGKSFLDATSEIQEIGATEVILLLDCDKRGKEGTKRLKQDLEHIKIKPNLKFWHDFSGLLSNEVQCVESLPSYLVTLKSKTNVQN